MSDPWRPAARVGEVPTGDVIAVEIDGIEMVLGKDGDRYFATQRRCLHRGGDLVEGIVSRGHLICPNHAWRFSTATGCHADGPPPETPGGVPTKHCLVTYAVRVVGDEIEIDPTPAKGRDA